MKFLKFIACFSAVLIAGCGHYATLDRPESENIVNAPVAVVWENTLKLLPAERIDVQTTDKATYTITGVKRINVWTWGDDVRIRLIPHGDHQTVVDFEVTTRQPVGWGHAERMVKSIFQKIKNASEGTPGQK